MGYLRRQVRPCQIPSERCRRKQKENVRGTWDSNPQPPASKADALSIAPIPQVITFLTNISRNVVTENYVLFKYFILFGNTFELL